ncbi:MAG: hypothetical protein ACOCTI_00235 [Phycisphaeraceae bacterium]
MAGPAFDAETYRTWRTAAGLPRVDRALRDLYARLDAEVASHEPVCRISGRCCRFREFGHRLYVTGLEIAWFLRQLPAEQHREPDAADPAGTCPYQLRGLCSTHTIRPMGCRVFFCQPGSEDWQNELYEFYLAELRDLHDREGLAYRYLDWIAGLEAAAEVTKR